jgi:hypothetical protein
MPSADFAFMVASQSEDGAGGPRPLSGYLSRAEILRLASANESGEFRVVYNAPELRVEDEAGVARCVVMEFAGPDFSTYRLWDPTLKQQLNARLEPVAEAAFRRVVESPTMAAPTDLRLREDPPHRLRLSP